MFSEGLGRLFNVHAPADNVYISLAEASGVTFIGFEDGTTSSMTITFSTDAAGSSTATPAVLDHFYAKAADQSSGVWHRTAVSPASNSTGNKSATTEDTVAVYVSAASCPDGKPWVKCDMAGSGTVTAILHDLAYARAPQNLRSVIA
jgi:hypothetical protein